MSLVNSIRKGGRVTRMIMTLDIISALAIVSAGLYIEMTFADLLSLMARILVATLVVTYASVQIRSVLLLSRAMQAATVSQRTK